MNTTFQNIFRASVLPMTLVALFFISHSVQAKTDTLIIQQGESSQDKQQAAMQKEQWDDTRNLRKKVIKGAEKAYDKADAVEEARDNCLKSSDVNAYWEPDTKRCLDRHTGQLIAP